MIVTAQELAKELKVSPRTISNWIKDRRIPFMRLSPRMLRFHLPRVQRALERFEVCEVGRRPQ